MQLLNRPNNFNSTSSSCLLQIGNHNNFLTSKQSAMQIDGRRQEASIANESVPKITQKFGVKMEYFTKSYYQKLSKKMYNSFPLLLHVCYFFLKNPKFQNQHCASSIDTLSILVRHARIFNKLLNAINLYLILISSSRPPMPMRLVVQSYFFQQLSSLC